MTLCPDKLMKGPGEVQSATKVAELNESFMRECVLKLELFPQLPRSLK